MNGIPLVICHLLGACAHEKMTIPVLGVASPATARELKPVVGGLHSSGVDAPDHRRNVRKWV